MKKTVKVMGTTQKSMVILKLINLNTKTIKPFIPRSFPHICLRIVSELDPAYVRMTVMEYKIEKLPERVKFEQLVIRYSWNISDDRLAVLSLSLSLSLKTL